MTPCRALEPWATHNPTLPLVSSLACLFPLPAVLLSLFGLEAWRRLWIRRQMGSIPALPGLLLGLIAWLLLRLFFQTP